ncbi:helix-turn-helix domain-containing protein [Pseudoduganella aquatica]|uniref:Helix-turn-helix domain-containing protein n=1 Tax=Pseudoduganella aquatica TaxID=2660641 RepID=A0A7X4KNZ8_9BURK|nr:helix-turn-helix transcriptional regulator [Pseudoduganella aquatica]MYN09400.1 helix-turn-helix domain-containing protein [Pseudoduganella aquatica]
MNFGEKLKHIRTEKNLTQPQLAAAIGIEQSYLSKLENDKSQPSADMFSTIVKALEMAPADFLNGIDSKVLQTSLRHIPEVSHFLNGNTARRVHDAKKWLFGAASACALGFALMLAANDGIFSSNNQYKYISKGVILPDESDNVFDQFKEVLNLKLAAATISSAEHARMLAEFEAARVRLATAEFWGDRGSVFFEAAGKARRKFELAGVRYVRSPVNKVLQYLGALFAFCGVLAFLVEWRLRRANAVISKGDA